MPPRPWLRIEGGIYHVCARGTEGRAVYHDDADRRDFLSRLTKAVVRCGWLCHAYCLMTNHYHLLLETPRANLPTGMHLVNGGYAKRFNVRYDHVGHLFQARYRGVAVIHDPHFVQTAAYIDLNPVRAGLVASPSDWPWSSHAAATGLARPPAFLSVEPLLSCFDDNRLRAVRRYVEFVAEKQATDSWDVSFEGMD